MTVSAGGEIFFSAASFAIVASVPATDFCFPSVPHWMMATGVSGGIPCAMSDFVQSPRFSVPISTTFVPGIFAICVVAQICFCVVGIFVAGENGEAGAMVAVRERNARVIRRGDNGRNARHDFKMNFRRRERLGFFRRRVRKYKDRRP